MKRLTVMLLSLICVGAASAQEKTYFPTTKGAELTYKYYNARGKALKDEWKNERWMKFTVEDIWPQEDGMVINVAVRNETIDRIAKKKPLETAAEDLSYGDVKIEGGTVTTDNMQWLVDPMPNYLSYLPDDHKIPYRVELAALSSFPREMAVGDTLPDEDMYDAQWKEVLTEEQIAEREKAMEEMKDRMKELEMEMMSVGGRVLFSGSSSGSTAGITVKASTRNRKIEAVETVVTPAGTFECYKMTYELVRPGGSGFGGMSITVMHGGGMMMGGPHMMGQQQTPADKYTDWISPEVGLVKREKYNERGKVQERMVLESYKK